MSQVISFVQEKGGAGKSTLLCCIASLLSKNGASVAIIDTDINKDSFDWVTSTGVNVDALPLLDDSKLAPTIRKLRDLYDVILIDTAGYKSAMSTFAMGQSDMVLIPCNAGTKDTQKAINTFNYIKTTEDNLGKQIASRVVFVAAKKHTNSTKHSKEKLTEVDGLEMLSAGLWYVDSMKEFFEESLVPKGDGRAHTSEVVGALQIEGILKQFYKENSSEVVG